MTKRVARDAIAILGQSNAAGAGRGQGEDPDRRVKQLAGSGLRKGRVIDARDPLRHHQKAAGVGFGLTFGKLHAARFGRDVLLVPTAHGSSGFHPSDGVSWDPDLRVPNVVNLFDFAVTQIDAALATGANLRGVLWLQGENDTRFLDAAEYASRLDAVIHGLRDRFEEVPFVIGGMNPDRMEEWGHGYPAIDRAHREAPARHAKTVFVEGPRNAYNAEDDKLHYSAAGQLELGRRIFDAYVEIAG